ncbi:alpha/beta fold hydrolase [Nocardia sp. CA-128927]|uniref:alpha/beta fold hydrolase n=1 Tax=Nocardia sp. CA-128927 TaxID=3239975 RepID=UPI003D9794B9
MVAALGAAGFTVIGLDGRGHGRVRSLCVGGVGSGVVDLGTVDTRVGNDDAIVESLLADDPATLPAGPAARFRQFADTLGVDRLAMAAVLSAGHTKVTGLDTIAVPTLVLAGDNDPFAAEPERLAAAIPTARLVQVSGDHMGALNDPAFSTALVDFLVELDT